MRELLQKIRSFLVDSRGSYDFTMCSSLIDDIDEKLAKPDQNSVLAEYANPLNWADDGNGIRRLWLEPGSNSPEAYNGFELARSACTLSKYEPLTDEEILQVIKTYRLKIGLDVPIDKVLDKDEIQNMLDTFRSIEAAVLKKIKGE